MNPQTSGRRALPRVPRWLWGGGILIILAVVAAGLTWYGSQPQSKTVRGEVNARSEIATFVHGDAYASYLSYFPIWTNVLQIGDRERAIPAGMHVELYGQLWITSSPAETDAFIADISGEATSVRFNGEEQLPARWSITERISEVAVTAIITSIISGVVGVAIGWLVGRSVAQSS